MSDELLAEVRGLRQDLRRNTEATERLAEAIEGMAVILAQDLAVDDADAAGDEGQPASPPAYADGTPIG